MDILIISGIGIIVVLVVIMLVNAGNKKKINYKDRMMLDTILDNEELPEKEVRKIPQKSAKESSDVFHPKTKLNDDSIIKLTDDSLKYYNKGISLIKEKKYEESIPYLN